jgi:hypothetical protein
MRAIDLLPGKISTITGSESEAIEAVGKGRKC